MSQPPVGPDPNQQPGYQQPGYEQPAYQQPGSQQPYGSAPAPQPGYGSPAATKRPGVVTAAAVLAFISGGLNLLGALVLLIGSNLADDLGISSGLIVVFGLISLVFGAALIFGGLQAIGGKDQRILVATAAAAIVLQLLYWIIVQFDGTSVLSLVLPAVIIALLMQPQSKQWFQSKGAPTF